LPERGPPQDAARGPRGRSRWHRAGRRLGGCVVSTTESTMAGLVDVARRFYVLGQTQQEIARAFGVDASTVSRTLKRARATGVVRIEIRPPHQLRDALSRDLAQRYGLQNAV